MIIQYQTALLAKEKGLDKIQRIGSLALLYDKDGKPCTYMNYGVMGSGLNDGYIYGPQQFFLQQWLRDEKKLHINIAKYINWYGDIGRIVESLAETDYELTTDDGKTYEEALEIALVGALNLL